MTYEEFLSSKVIVAPERGYPGPIEISPNLKPFAGDIAAWAIRGGNQAIFASFGLHKTSIQLQIAAALLAVHPGSSALIVCPLGVKREFIGESRRRGFTDTPLYVRTNEEHATAVAAAI